MIPSVGSNNIDYLLQSYRSLEERPIQTLQQKKSSIDNRISLFSDLKSKLKSLESLAKDLSYSSSTSVYGSKAATNSDDTYLTVTTGSSAIATSHTVTVSQLAKADQVVSNQYNLSSTELFSALGAGTQAFNVTVNGDSYAVSVDIAADDDNESVLDKIVSAVNDTTDITISASVVKDTETTGRLVFSSNDTGSDYEMTLSDTSGSLLSTIGMDDSIAMSGTSGGYVYASTELNAQLTVDGIAIERNSNTIEDAIEGLTLTLQKTHDTGEVPVTINVSNDAETIKGKLQKFIDAYNEVLSFIQTNTHVDSDTHKRSALSGDFAISSLKLKLRDFLSRPVTGLTSGNATILPELGITTDRQGKLSISDSDKLDDYLEGNLNQVSDLFNSSDGFANRLTSFLGDYTDGQGIIESRKDILQSQITQVNTRISRLEKSVDRKMEYYRQQFSQLQAAYAMYSSQSSSLGSIVQSGYISY